MFKMYLNDCPDDFGAMWRYGICIYVCIYRMSCIINIYIYMCVCVCVCASINKFFSLSLIGLNTKIGSFWCEMIK